MFFDSLKQALEACLSNIPVLIDKAYRWPLYKSYFTTKLTGINVKLVK